MQEHGAAVKARGKRGTYRRRRDAGLCTACGQPANGALLCPCCLEVRAERKRQKRSRWCECGNASAVGSTACKRCLELDWDGGKDFDVLQAFRVADAPMSIGELARETRRHRDSISRSLNRLLRAGRVERFFDGDMADKRGSCRHVLWRLA